MKKITIPLLLTFLFLFSSCEAIKGIFSAGVYTGVIMVVVVVALIIWLIAKFTGRS
ncbi:MAG: hypothetical protein ACOH2A_02580 [Sphingobacteriaceae bacterium]